MLDSPEAHGEIRAVALSFVKDEAKPRRGAARQGRVLDQVQSRSKLAGMDLRRSPSGRRSFSEAFE